VEGRAYDLARALLECACERLADECPDRRCVVPGNQVSWDNCCSGKTGGQLTVHVVQAYPSRTFPDPDLRRPANCDTTYTVLELVVTILRCSPVGDGPHPATCEELDSTAQQALRDLERVRDSTACCLLQQDALKALLRGPYAWAFGQQLSLGPDGGCAGSELHVLVGMLHCREC
jgi:hypothetical protein